MSIVIGLDLGTTHSKALALEPDGRVAGLASSEYGLHSPQRGWVEQEASQVWEGARKSLHSLIDQLGEKEVAGICLSGAMHSLLPVDQDGEPLAPAMTWADQRSAQQALQLHSQVDAHALYLRTGCPLQAIYHPAKLRWWQEEAPQIARQAAFFISIKDWVLHQLTGEWVTDFGLASTTGLLNIHTIAWDEEALALSGISPNHLPRLVPPTEIAGKVSTSAARLSGLSSGTPIIAGSSDGGLANLGAGAHLPRQSVITVGTSGAVRRVVDRPLLDPQERTWCYLLGPNRWFAGGAINNGGLALQWVRDHFYGELKGESGYQQLLDEAGETPPGAGGVFFLPYFTGERSPHWDASARAVLAGLGLEHSRGHIARAAMEGVAYCLADVWEALADAQGAAQGPVLLTGGITRAPLWSQIVADVLGERLSSLEAADASATGAAMTGHQALSSANLEDLLARLPGGTQIDPDPSHHQLYHDGHKEFQKLYRQCATS